MHRKDKVASAYDRAKFLDERKAMMQAWADYVQAVEQAASGSVPTTQHKLIAIDHRSRPNDETVLDCGH